MSAASNRLKHALTATLLLTLCVLCAGAYTRLTHAGLGCPDWPGCYQQWYIPADPTQHATLQTRYPETPLNPEKAHTEMGHRYLAGLLGLAILALGLGTRGSHAWPSPGFARRQWLLLLGAVTLQAALGRWTVTLALHPLVVSAHLALGLGTLSLLAVWRLQPVSPPPTSSPLLPLIRLCLGLLCLQIVLGAWTSTRYAALVCPDFPGCHPSLPWDWSAWRSAVSVPLAPGLGTPSLGALRWIHMAHRVGALVLTGGLGWLILRLLQYPRHPATRQAAALALALGVQLALGIGNVYWQLPLALACAHHAGAIALLLIVLWIWIRPPPC